MKTKAPETLESLTRNVRSQRIVFGVSIILMALVLMYCLPAVVENSTFRAYRISSLTHQDTSDQDMDADGMDDGMDQDMDMSSDMSGMDMGDASSTQQAASSSAAAE